MDRRLTAIMLIVLAILIGGSLYTKYRIAPRMDFDKLELTDLNGKKVALKSFKGTNLVVSFFATWCGPCLEELQSQQLAQAKLKKDNFFFICISDESPQLLKAFKQSRGLNLLMLHSDEKIKEKKVYTLPTSYILNTKGFRSL